MAHESRQVPPTLTPATTLLPAKIIMQRTRNPERALLPMPWGAGAASLAEKWILDVLCVQLAGPRGRQWGQGGGDCPHQLLTLLPDALLQSLDAQGWRPLSHVSYTWWGQNLETELFVIGRHGRGGSHCWKQEEVKKKGSCKKKGCKYVNFFTWTFLCMYTYAHTGTGKYLCVIVHGPIDACVHMPMNTTLHTPTRELVWPCPPSHPCTCVCTPSASS